MHHIVRDQRFGISVVFTVIATVLAGPLLISSGFDLKMSEAHLIALVGALVLIAPSIAAAAFAMQAVQFRLGKLKLQTKQ
ncbi:MAG: hypothetical protein AAGF28_11100 [Pseudomonadota bacterium]